MLRIQLELSIDQLIDPDDGDALKRMLFKLGYVPEHDAPVNISKLSRIKAIELLRMLGEFSDQDHSTATISVPEY